MISLLLIDPEFPEIGEKAFERVKAMQDAAKEKESSEQSRSSSKSNTKEKDLDIDIELPGIDVEIDESGVKVDAQGMHLCMCVRSTITHILVYRGFHANTK